MLCKGFGNSPNSDKKQRKTKKFRGYERMETASTFVLFVSYVLIFLSDSDHNNKVCCHFCVFNLQDNED